MRLAQSRAFWAVTTTLIGNHTLEVESTGKRGRMATESGQNCNEAVTSHHEEKLETGLEGLRIREIAIKLHFINK